MAEPNQEMGRAVKEALSWLDATPETAGALLGINARTLAAMCQGIVPMRSLVIRFATALGRHCERQDSVPEWWKDVDAWLTVAGYTPRRDADHTPAGSTHAHPPAGPYSRGAGPSGNGRLTDRPAAPAERAPANPGQPTYSSTGTPGYPPRSVPPASPSRSSPHVPPAPSDEALAGEFYRPVYERKSWGDSVVHIFWIVDPDDRKIYQINIPAHWDYKARAAQVKQDLHSLTRSHFERKYGRFRVNGS